MMYEYDAKSLVKRIKLREPSWKPEVVEDSRGRFSVKAWPNGKPGRPEIFTSMAEFYTLDARLTSALAQVKAMRQHMHHK